MRGRGRAKSSTTLRSELTRRGDGQAGNAACQALLGSSIYSTVPAKPSALLDTRVIYCGDNLDQLRKLPDGCVDLIYIDPPFNSNRNYEVFRGGESGPICAD